MPSAGAADRGKCSPPLPKRVLDLTVAASRPSSAYLTSPSSGRGREAADSHAREQHTVLVRRNSSKRSRVLQAESIMQRVQDHVEALQELLVREDESSSDDEGAGSDLSRPQSRRNSVTATPRSRSRLSNASTAGTNSPHPARRSRRTSVTVQAQKEQLRALQALEALRDASRRKVQGLAAQAGELDATVREREQRVVALEADVAAARAQRRTMQEQLMRVQTAAAAAASTVRVWWWARMDGRSGPLLWWLLCPRHIFNSEHPFALPPSRAPPSRAPHTHPTPLAHHSILCWHNPPPLPRTHPPCTCTPPAQRRCQRGGAAAVRAAPGDDRV
jgi:hypothetical protein